MPNVTQSKIFASKTSAIHYLEGLPEEGFDGKHYIARYWKNGEGSDIASVEGILHNTNGVHNIEIKDYEGSPATSSTAGGTDSNYVIKKRFPIFFKPNYNYYYQGNGIKFQIPSLKPGMFAQIIFPKGLVPYSGDVVSALRSSSRAWMTYEGCTVVAWTLISGAQRPGCYVNDIAIHVNFVETENYNLLNIYYDNHWGASTMPSITITMRPDNGACHNMLVTRDVAAFMNIGFGEYSVNDVNRHTIAEVTDERVYNLNYSLVGDPSVVVVDYRNKFDIVQCSPTKKTTSPGFLIEKGIIKCYRESRFVDVLKRYSKTENGGYWCRWWSSPIYYEDIGQPSTHHLTEDIHFVDYINKLPKTKNGIVLYYHPRNAFRGGIDTDTVVAHNYLINHICSHKKYSSGARTDYSIRGFRLRKEEGRIEYKAPINRGRYYYNCPDGRQDVACRINFGYAGVDVDNNRVGFVVGKYGETDTDITLKKIYIKFIGEDGNRHVGFFRFMGNDNNNVFASDYEGDRIVYAEGRLFIKDEISNNFSIADYELPSIFNGEINVINAEFSFDITKEKTKIALDCAERTGHSKWKLLNRLVYVRGQYTHRIPKGFNRQKFNTCRYYQKFKGVKSEFPETFYTR